ncbi:MAG TPA: glycosyltransferase family 61 protein [Dongiaceae bacterium]|nr:glycosyltransferase family 61 protein [Dongiaceae bacterium]
MKPESLIVQTEPQWLTLRDAIATPFALVALADAPDQPPRHPRFKVYTKGCLYDSGGGRIDLSVRVGGIGGDQAASIDPATLPPEQRGGTWLAGRTLYLGTFMNHYGHFITESLSRFWRQEAATFDQIVAYPFMHNDGAILMEEFHRYLGGLLDVPIDRMAVLRSQTVFDEIVVPEQLWTYNVHANVRMRELYGRIGARHAGRRSTGRIFLSRMDSSRLGNARAVEEIFAGFGFRVLYPERIAIAEQLSLYANCEILAGLSGSAMHNCLFARPGLMTIEVGDARSRRKPAIMQRIANELAQIEAHFIPFGEANDIRIDPKVVRKNLRNILGELPRRGPVLWLRLKRRIERLKKPRKRSKGSL